MANKKISQLTPKGSALAGTDLLEVSVYNGATYDTKSLTGANVVSGLQPTLFSGTNIKTINSTSLLGSGDIAISTGLTVGTTPITSGTVGRVLFEGTGNVVQQDSTLFWDNTNKRLGVGATPDVNTVLDVRSAGTLATDLAFRVRNSANTANLAKITGDGAFTVGTYTNGSARMTVSGSTNINFASEGGFTAGYFQPNQQAATIWGIQALARQNGANIGKGIYTGADGSSVGSTNYGIHSYAYYGTTNYAGYFDAYGGTNNYALVTQRGFSGFNKIDPSAIVDIKAAGALSTDIALRVRNSADSVDLAQFQGNGDLILRNNANTSYLNWQTTTGLEVKNGSSEFLFYNNNGIIGFQGTSGLRLRTTNTGIYINDSGNFYLGGATGISLGTGSNAIILKSGTVPSSNIADHYYTYSADIVAGNAAPHFRTENGNVIKLYQQTTAVTSATVVSGSGGNVKHDDTFDGYTLEQVVKALRNAGLLA
jgi:hypothetical protein